MSSVNGIPIDGTTLQIQLAPSNSELGIVGDYAGRLLDASGIAGIIGKPPRSLSYVESISWQSSLETTQPRGMGQTSTKGYTPGRIIYGPAEAEIWCTELVEWINSVGGLIGFYNQYFDMTITYKIGVGLPLQKVKLLGCRPLGVSTAHQISTSDNLTSTLTFGVTSISYGENRFFGAAAGINQGIKALV